MAVKKLHQEKERLQQRINKYDEDLEAKEKEIETLEAKLRGLETENNKTSSENSAMKAQLGGAGDLHTDAASVEDGIKLDYDSKNIIEKLKQKVRSRTASFLQNHYE